MNDSDLISINVLLSTPSSISLDSEIDWSLRAVRFDPKFEKNKRTSAFSRWDVFARVKCFKFQSQTWLEILWATAYPLSLLLLLSSFLLAIRSNDKSQLFRVTDVLFTPSRRLIVGRIPPRADTAHVLLADEFRVLPCALDLPHLLENICWSQLSNARPRWDTLIYWP